MRGSGRVIADQQFLVQLFTWAQAADRDLDITVGMLGALQRHARQLDHAARQVDDAHRRPHVEHEDIAALGHGAGLDHQLRRLGNGHEVAGDVGVGERDRPAALDLFAEQRHHRAARSEHVAEADHRKARCPAALRHRLQHQLGKPLARPHHIRRAHRLVGTDQHEVADAVFGRGLDGHQRAQHIVAHAFGRIVLDQRHMLVGRRMVDRIRAPGAHDFAHARLVAHRGQHRQEAYAALRRDRLQFLVNRVQRKLADLDQHQGRRLELHDLAAQFAADRTAGARHQHDLAANITVQQVVVRRHRIAAQQILDIELVQVAHPHLALGQIGQARQGAHVQRQLQLLNQAHDLGAPRTAHRRQGQQQVGHAAARDQPRQLRQRMHAQAIDGAALQVAGIVDETTHDHFTAAGERTRQLAPGRAGPVDQHLRQRAAVEVANIPPAQPITHKQAAAPNGHEQHQRNGKPDTARHTRHADEGEHQEEQQAHRRAGLDERHQRGTARKTEDGAVHAGDDIDWNGNANGSAQDPQLRRIHEGPVFQPETEYDPYGAHT